MYYQMLTFHTTEVAINLHVELDDRITTNGACYWRPISPEMMIPLFTVEDSGHSAGRVSTAHKKYLGPG